MSLGRTTRFIPLKSLADRTEEYRRNTGGTGEKVISTYSLTYQFLHKDMVDASEQWKGDG